MTVYVRSYCVAGVALLAAGAVAFTPAIVPTPPDITVPAVNLSATQAPPPELVKWLRELQEAAAHMPALSTTPAVSPNALPVASPAPTVSPSALPIASPAPQNAAGDGVVNVWYTALPWIDYGVNVVDGGLGWIPGIAIVGDQVGIVYYSLIRPVADSFVVDLVAPVLNAPLNINSYVNGLVTLGTVTVDSLVNLGVNEFNYFFGWLTPPVATTTTASSTLDALPAIDSIPSLAALGVAGTAGDVATAVTTAEADITLVTDTSGEADTRQGAAGSLQRIAESANTATTSAQDPVSRAASVPSTVVQAATEVGNRTREAAADITVQFRTAMERSLQQAGMLPKTPTTAAKGPVSAQGQVRSSVTEAATDAADAPRTRTPDRPGGGIANTPGTVAGAVSDSVKRAVKSLQQQPGRDAGNSDQGARGTGNSDKGARGAGNTGKEGNSGKE